MLHHHPLAAHKWMQRPEGFTQFLRKQYPYGGRTEAFHID
jgi:hypothetical protein